MSSDKKPITPYDINSPFFDFGKGVNLPFANKPTGFGRPDSLVVSPKDYETYKDKVDLGFSSLGGERALQEGRALRQTGLELVGKSVAKIADEVVFGLLHMLDVPAIYGIFTGNEKLIDNAYGRAIDALDQATLGKLSEVYTPPSLEKGSLSEQIFNPYFFANEGAQGLGTMLSFFAPGVILKGLKVGSAAAKGVSKLGRLANVAADGSELIAQSPNMFGKFVLKTMGSTGRGLDFGRLAGNIDSALAVGANTLMEAGAEATEAYDTYIKQGFSVEEASQKAQNVFLMNTALLTISNTLLERYVFDGFNRMPSTKNLIIDALKGNKIKYRPFQNALLKTTAGVLSEGFIEEGLQTSMTQAADTEFDNSVMNTLSQYFKNISGLFGDNPNIEFGKSVFLGSVLGGTMGGVKGFYEVNQQKRLMEGAPAQDPNKLMQAVFNKKAREAQEGLVSIFTSNFEKIKKGKEYLKNKNSAEILQDETAMFALSNAFEDYVTYTRGDINLATGMLTNILINEVGLNKNEANSLIQKLAPEKFSNMSKSEALNFIQHRRDTSYFTRFANNPEGFKILDAHIDDMVDGLQERYELNTGLKFSEDEKNKIKTEIKEKAKKFENTYKAAKTFNSNIRYNIKVDPEQKSEFNNFILLNNEVAQEAMNLKMYVQDGIQRIEQETTPITNKIEALENMKKNLLADTSKSKDEKDKIKEDYDKQIKDEKDKIIEYDAKINDLKMYKEALSELNNTIIETSTKDKLQEKWDSHINKQKEKKQKELGKYKINGRQIDIDDKLKLHLTLMEIFNGKGYTATLDPNTGSVTINTDEFYIDYGNTIYTVSKYSSTDSAGVVTNQFKLQDYDTGNETLLSGWTALIKTLEEFDIINKDEFDGKAQTIDIRKKKEEAERIKAAMLQALEQMRVELWAIVNKREKDLAKLQNMLKKHIEFLKNVKENISKETDQAKLNKLIEGQENLAKVIDILKNKIDKAKLNLQLAITKFEGVNSLYTSVKFDKFNKKAYSEKQGFQTNIEILKNNKQDVSQFQNIIDQIEKEFDNDFKNADAILVEIGEILEKEKAIIANLEALKAELEETKQLIDKIVAESKVVNNGLEVDLTSLPADFESKFPGLKELLAKIKNEKEYDKLFEYFRALNNYSKDYVKNIDDFIKIIKPYLSVNQDVANQLKPPKSITDSLEELTKVKNQKDIAKYLAAVSVYNSMQNDLNSKVSLIINELEKEDLKQQETNGDVENPLDILVEADEGKNKVTSVFSTSGRNLLQDVDGNDELNYDDEFKVNVPIPEPDNGKFFKWLDQSKGESYSVIPYHPNWNENDFMDITDETTAKLMQEMIRSTPDAVKENALYSVIVHKVAGQFQVRVFEGTPIFTSIMLPDTRFPEGKESKVAGRFNVMYFLKQVLDVDYVLSTKVYKEDKVAFEKDQIETLKEYGILIDENTVFQDLEPYARIYNRERYKLGFASKLESSKNNYASLEERVNNTAFEVQDNKFVSEGFVVSGYDSNSDPVVYDLNSLGLEYDANGTPSNFSIIMPDFRGNYSNMKTNRNYSGLKPGVPYIEFINKDGLIPVQTGTLTDNEVKVVLHLISQYDSSSRTLQKKIPGLNNKHYIFYKRNKIPLNELDILPTNSNKKSLMGMLINWGFDSKNPSNPYRIYIAKGRLHFGARSIKLDDVKKAYNNNNLNEIADLVNFLRNKRLNVNYGSLNNNSASRLNLKVKEDRSGNKYLSSEFVAENYTQFLLSRSFSRALPQDIRDKHGLPMFAQKYIKFKDFSKPTDSQKVEIKDKVKATIASTKPQPKPKPTNTGTPSLPNNVKNKLNELITALENNDIETAKLAVSQLQTTPAATANSEVKGILGELGSKLNGTPNQSDLQSFINRLKSVLNNQKQPEKIDPDKIKIEFVKEQVAIGNITKEAYEGYSDMLYYSDLEIFDRILWDFFSDSEILDFVFKYGFYNKINFKGEDNDLTADIINLNKTEISNTILKIQQELADNKDWPDAIIKKNQKEIHRLKLVLEQLEQQSQVEQEEKQPELQPEQQQEFTEVTTTNGTVIKVGNKYKSKNNTFTVVKIIPDKIIFEDSKGKVLEYGYNVVANFIKNGENKGWIQVIDEEQFTPTGQLMPSNVEESTPTPEPQPIISADNIVFEVGDIISMTSGEYTINEVSGNIITLNNGVSYNIEQLRGKIKRNVFTYKQKATEKRSDAIQILNNAVERGIIERINCN